jgi:ankyrin repeat protein
MSMHKGVTMAMHFMQLPTERHDSVVTLLLEKGADVNAQGGHYGNALQAACHGGHDSVVTLLLEKGLMSMHKGVIMAMHFRQLPMEVMTLL